MKNVSQHATQWKIVFAFADKVVVSTLNETVDSPVLSTCLSAACLVLETVERQKHHMQVMKVYCYTSRES